MKVLLLADGRAFHTIRYQAELKKQGVEVILASLEKGDTVDIQLQKKSVSNSLNYVFVNREIKQLRLKINPDIINAHFASAYGFSVALSKVWQKVPVLLHCLGSDILISPQKSVAHKRKVAFALEKAGHILADSVYLAEKIKRLHSTATVDIIPWGVEPEILEIYKQKAETAFKLTEPFRVLVPRPHTDIYNNLFIVKSLRQFINDDRISLTFPSWGDDALKFKKFAEASCPGKINYYRRLEREKYIEFLSGFDIYLSAALSDSSPASLLEAMGGGLIPIVGDIPGVREWVNDKEQNGFLFNPKEAGSLKKAVEKLFDMPDDIKTILENNHTRIDSEALFSSCVSKTIDIMQNLIKNE
jgi:L-malate glycosyltransferase